MFILYSHFLALFLIFLYNNSVAIGAKFDLIDDTFVLRIQQGQLLPNGSIDPETISWENGTLTKALTRDRIKIRKSNGNTDMKAFALTEVKLPQGRVVVGLGIKVIQGNNSDYDNRIGLAAFSSSINFKNGTVHPPKHLFKPSAGSEKLLMYKKRQRDTVFTKGDQYILIDESGEESERKDDIGTDEQVIPLLDTQELTQKLMPLSGAGLFLRRLPSEKKNIVGIKLFNYDISTYVNTDVY